MSLFQIIQLFCLITISDAPGLGNAGVASVAFCVAITTGVAVTWLNWSGKWTAARNGQLDFSFENVD